MSDRSFRYLTLIISILAHIIAYWQFQMTSDRLVHNNFEYQLKLLLVASLLQSIIITFISKEVIIWLNIFIKGIFLLLISISFSGYIGVPLTLFIAFVLELFSNYSLTGSLIYSLILLFVIIKAQHNSLTAFSIDLPDTSLHDILSFLFYSGFVISLSAIIKYKRENHVSLRELSRRLNESTVELAETNIQLQDHVVEAEHEAASKERKEIAREIHDSLAYSLTNIIMMTEAGIDIAGDGNTELLEHLKKVRDQAKEGLKEVRRTLRIVRTPLQNKETGLKAIKQLIDSFKNATKIDIVLSFGNVPLHFNEELEKTAYRVVQEGLTNAIRHGKASKVVISFSRRNEWLNIYIKDNGIGCEGMDMGYGLQGMKERIENLGGKLECSSEAGKGYLLSVWIPMNEVEKVVEDKSITG